MTKLAPPSRGVLALLGLLVAAALVAPAAAGAAEEQNVDQGIDSGCDGLGADNSSVGDAQCTFPPVQAEDIPQGNRQPERRLVAWTSAVDLNPFRRFRGGIFIGRIDGTDVRKLTTFENGNRDFAPHGLNEPDDHPSFSPDGRKLVFTSNRADRRQWEIWTMNVNGTSPRRLTFDRGLNTEPVFSPDGEKIAYASRRIGSLDIWLMNADGSGQPQFVTGTFPAAEIEPAWSPDGSLLAFTRVQGDGEKDVFVVRPDGTGLRQVTNVPKEDHDATFSPDGQRLVITSERPPTSPPFGNVHVIRLSDGASLGDLTPDHAFGAGDPFWSSDGKKIAYFKSFLPTLGPQQLFVMNADGSGKRHIPGEGTVNVHPAMGRAVDTDGDRLADFLESGSVGAPLLGNPGRIRAGRTAVVRFGWRHPRAWRRLDKVVLQVVRGRRAVAAIRFLEDYRSLSLWNARRGHWGPPHRLGRGVARAGLLTLDLRRTRFINNSRSTMTLELAVRFERVAAGRRGLGYRFETLADDDDARSQQERLAGFRVVP